jgi:ABC-type dipeptide/oligopeptide/nickel transport system permease component
MPKVSLSHFEAALLFALFTSIVMGVTTKRNDHERVRYAVQCFAYFLVALFGLGWLMYLGHG